MSYQDWEFFASVVDNKQFFVVDAGPLFGPIRSFEIKRDENRQLLLKSVSAGNSSTNREAPKENLVKVADGEVKFQCRHNASQAVAKGILTKGFSVSYKPILLENSSGSIKEEISHIASLDWWREEDEAAAYVIEWVENISGNFIWPNFEDSEEVTVRKRTIKSNENDVTLTSQFSSRRGGRSCARLEICGVVVIFGKANLDIDSLKSPGYIMYLAAPEEGLRERIRACLSFLLGDYLVYLGWTAFDEHWSPVGFSAVSAGALLDEAYQISGRPPAPLGNVYQNEIDASILGSMTEKMLSVYEKYQLGKVFWSYWHAKAAPIHMAAAHYGAAMEGLQKSFIKHNDLNAGSRIVVEEEKWNELAKALKKCVNDADLESEQKQLLQSKISQVNDAPKSWATKKFFASLSMNLGAVEHGVWRNRNKAAHGDIHKEGDEIEAVRENNAFLTLLNRTLLSLSGAGNSYYDYYNLEKPKRSLAEAIPKIL